MVDTDFADPASFNDLLFLLKDWGPFESMHVLAHGPYGDLAAARNGALEAIHDVAAQGEGTVTEPNSHFDRLLGIYTAATAPGVVLPAILGVENPHTSPQIEGDAGLITDCNALKVAWLLNLRYWMMMTEIGHAATVKRGAIIGGKNLKITLTSEDWAKKDMHVVARLSDKLIKMPLKAGASAAADPKASAPFGLPNAFPSTDLKRWKFYLRAMDESKAIVTELAGSVPGLELIDLADKEHNMKLLLEDNLRLKQKMKLAKDHAARLIKKV